MLNVSRGKEEHRAALVWEGAPALRNRKAHVAFPIIMENQCFIKNLGISYPTPYFLVYSAFILPSPSPFPSLFLVEMATEASYIPQNKDHEKPKITKANNKSRLLTRYLQMFPFL